MSRAVIAVHGSGGFAPRWCEAARSRGLGVREVNGYDSDILAQLKGCSAFLWNLDHENRIDLEHGRHVLEAAAAAGLRVFPDHATSWHFDDKIAQKYLLEAVGAPLARSWVFYSKANALDFLSTADYPMVLKLRCGAGSLNVHLVKSYREGARLVGRMFGAGMRGFPPGERLKRAVARGRSRRQRDGKLVRRAVWVVRRIIHQAVGGPRERDYTLLQEFVPGNDHDIRVTVIGERCWTYLRSVRAKDFRASGSGLNTYLGRDEIPMDAVEVAFSLSRRLAFQSMAYDFVRDHGDGRVRLLEISYSFVPQFIANCPGFFGPDRVWHEGVTWPQDVILEDLLH